MKISIKIIILIILINIYELFVVTIWKSVINVSISNIFYELFVWLWKAWRKCNVYIYTYTCMGRVNHKSHFFLKQFTKLLIYQDKITLYFQCLKWLSRLSMVVLHYKSQTLPLFSFHDAIDSSKCFIIVYMAHKPYLLFDIAGVLITEYRNSIRWLKETIN